MRKSAGFTLLEILVAMAIFAIVGIMAMGGYMQLSRQSEHVTDSMQRARNVEMTMFRLTQDFGELEPRPVRDPLGSSSQPALIADGRGTALATFTRAGWANPAGIARSTLQRADYRLDDDKLYRDYWPVLDPTLTVQPIQVPLLDRVRGVHLRFMDSNHNWSDQWPPTSAQTGTAANVNLDARPIAVEVTLDLEDWGKIVRLIEVPG